MVPCVFHQLSPKAITSNAWRSAGMHTRLPGVASPPHSQVAPCLLSHTREPGPGAPCLLPLLVILPGLQQAAPRLPPQGLWRPPFCLESQIRPSGKFPRSVPDLAVCLWPQCSEGAGSRLTSLSAPALLLSPEFGCGFVLAREKALRIPWGGAQVCGVPRLRGPRLASFGTPFVSGARRAALTRVISAPSVLYATGYPRCQVRKPHLRDLVTG